jgi:hypothetical protein
MPIRGKRSIWPKAPKNSGGLFGASNDKSTSKFPNQGTKAYAHSTNTRCKPHKGDGGLAAANKHAERSKGQRGYLTALNKFARA